MQHDYVPRRDADFAAWLAQYWTTLETFWTDHGLDDSDLKDLRDAVDDWTPAWPAHIAARAAADAAMQSKDAARRAVEAALRPITRFVQAFPETTDADRANLGITVPGGTSHRVVACGTGYQPVTSRPRLTVEPAGRLAHRLRIYDEASSNGSDAQRLRRARPPGARAAEVYLALTAPHEPAPPPPTSKPRASNFALRTSAPFQLFAAATRDTLTIPYPLAAAGQTAHVLARWIGSGGATGAWSEVASATVAG